MALYKENELYDLLALVRLDHVLSSPHNQGLKLPLTYYFPKAKVCVESIQL